MYYIPTVLIVYNLLHNLQLVFMVYSLFDSLQRRIAMLEKSEGFSLVFRHRPSYGMGFDEGPINLGPRLDKSSQVRAGIGQPGPGLAWPIDKPIKDHVIRKQKISTEMVLLIVIIPYLIKIPIFIQRYFILKLTLVLKLNEIQIFFEGYL